MRIGEVRGQGLGKQLTTRLVIFRGELGAHEAELELCEADSFNEAHCVCWGWGRVMEWIANCGQLGGMVFFTGLPPFSIDKMVIIKEKKKIGSRCDSQYEITNTRASFTHTDMFDFLYNHMFRNLIIERS